jgi:hypothetical protein
MTAATTTDATIEDTTTDATIEDTTTEDKSLPLVYVNEFSCNELGCEVW